MVVIQTDLYWARTAPPIMCMTSLTEILFVYFVPNSAVAFPLQSNLQTEIERFGRLAA